VAHNTHFSGHVLTFRLLAKDAKARVISFFQRSQSLELLQLIFLQAILKFKKAACDIFPDCCCRWQPVVISLLTDFLISINRTGFWLSLDLSCFDLSVVLLHNSEVDSVPQRVQFLLTWREHLRVFKSDKWQNHLQRVLKVGVDLRVRKVFIFESCSQRLSRNEQMAH
jgi:hypothetical protein